jgi:ATP-dependent Clp protease ATP-binding subunit ClpA
MRCAKPSAIAVLPTVDKLRGGETVNEQNTETNRDALNKYTLDLTQCAQDGKLISFAIYRYRHLDYSPRLNYQWLYQHCLSGFWC